MGLLKEKFKFWKEDYSGELFLGIRYTGQQSVKMIIFLMKLSFNFQ